MVCIPKSILSRIAIKISVLVIVWWINPQLYAQNLNLRFNHITVKDGLAQNRVMGIAKDKYGFMWFTTWDGISKYDGCKFINYVANKNNPKSLQNNRVVQMCKDIHDNLWFLTFDNLILRYNYESDDFTILPKSNIPKAVLDSLNRNITTFFNVAKTNDYVWQVNQIENVLSKNISPSKIDNLLVQTNRKTGDQIVYKHSPLNLWSLNDEYVFCIHKDDNDIFWVGTYGGGVNKADLRQKKFSLYQHSIIDNNTIIDNAVRAICEDNTGKLWIGTNNSGVSKFDRKLNRCTHFQYNIKDSINSLVSNQVRVIYCDRYGYIWIGTKFGLDRFDPKNNRFYHYTTWSKSRIPNNSVFWITEDRAGYLWIGTMNGIAKYNRKINRFFVYPTKYGPQQQRVREILIEENNFWIATDGGGLLHLKRDTTNGFNEKITLIASYISVPSNSNSLSDNRIYSIVKDNNGNIWLGTGGGLDLLNPRNGTFKHFNKSIGMTADFILGLLKDEKGNIWVSHNKGLSKINSSNFKIRNYGQQDGLQDDEFSENAFFKSNRTDEMFFGGTNGFNSFFPDSITNNPFLPKVVLTSLEISNTPVPLNVPFNGRIILKRPLYMTQSITLTNQDKIFTIEFAALHYSNPNNNKYAFKLEGFDKEWIYTDFARRTATYSNLEPGTYTFKVVASNNDGIWNPIPTQLLIKVLPPYWKTLWFKIICVLLFIISLYVVYYLRLDNYQKKQLELSLLVKIRTQELEKTNEQLLLQQSRIEEQAEEIQANAEDLKKANECLLDRQKHIEKQSEEIKANADNVKEVNSLLLEKQKVIQLQNEQLFILNSTKDRFFSIIAHDLRNPFHVVSGFSELLLTDFQTLPLEKIEKYLNLIYTTSVIGSNLLENLLLWSRSQTGRISFDPAKLILASIAEETINFMAGDAQNKNISVQQLINNTVTVFADENMVKTVFRNLISNAIKFTKENGTITINSTVVDSYVEVSIVDDGVGIPPENLQLLFRLDTTISTKGTSSEIGTGLGLIICKEFIERNNGKISVESEPGKGSTFKFTLPQS